MRLRIAGAAAVVLLAAASVQTGSAAEPDVSPAAGPAKVTLAVNGTYQPIAGHFDCDSGSDEPEGQHTREEPGIVWYAPGSAPDYLWTDLSISGSQLRRTQTSLKISGTYKPLVGDFDQDRCDDILWYGAGTAPDVLWWGGPNGFTGGTSIAVNGSYRPAAFGQRWILWYAPNGTEFVWEGTGNRSAPFRTKSFPQVTGSGYQPVAFYDGWNGLAEILWYTPGTGPDSIWAINPWSPGLDVETKLPVTINGSYRTTGFGSQVVLHGPGAAVDQYLSTTFSQQVNFTRFAISGSYRPSGSGRLLVWHAPGSASDQIWLTPPPG